MVGNGNAIAIVAIDLIGLSWMSIAAAAALSHLLLLVGCPTFIEVQVDLLLSVSLIAVSYR